MAPVKRPAAASGAPSKKGKKDPVLAKCAIIEAALKEATFLPDTACTMLAAMVSSSLATVKEERHPYQVSIVTQLGGALAGIKAKIEKDLAEAKAKVDGIDAMKLAREAALAEAEASLTALQGATAGCKAALEEAKEAEGAASKAEEDTIKEQKTADAGLDELAAKKAALETAKGTELATLGAEEVPEKAKKAALKTLVKLGKEHGFDSSLLDALPTVLKTAAAEGAGFASIIVKQLEEEFEKAVAGLTKSIEEGAPGKAERAAAVEAAKAASEAAAGKAQESVAALGSAKAAEKAGVAALKAAKQSLESYLPDVKEVMDHYDDLKKALPTFIEGALAAYNELKELMPPPPPPPPPAEPEEPPAEEPAAVVA